MHLAKIWTLTLVAVTIPRLSVAQAPAAPAPPVTIGGVVYGQYRYLVNDTAAHVNQFDVTRAYLNVIGRFDGGLMTRVTGDVYRAADNSLVYRLKYAHFGWTPKNSPVTYKFGLLQTSWIDWEEALWDYRMQGTMPAERAGYLSSSDFGIAADGNFNKELVDAQVAIVNGANYNGGSGDQHKVGMARVSVRLAPSDDASRVGGLRLTGFAMAGKPAGGGVKNRYIGMLSFKNKIVAAAAEFVATDDSVFSSVPANVKRDTKGRVIAFYGTVKPPKSSVAFIARVDLVDPNTNVTGDKQTRFIGGLSYQLNSHIRLLADLDALSFETTPSPAAYASGTQLMFQTQITF
jgi:hypothetical protein